MPNFDGRGPMGMGPGSGRGRGPCQPQTKDEKKKALEEKLIAIKKDLEELDK